MQKRLMPKMNSNEYSNQLSNLLYLQPFWLYFIACFLVLHLPERRELGK